jgi:hypothetical protein
VPNPANGTTASITPTHLGKYVIKATCGNSNDTFDLYCYRIEFEKDTTTHVSMEGHPAGGGIEYIELPSVYGSANFSPTSSSFVTNSADLLISMVSDDAAYIADKGAGSWLQPSGEIRYDFYLNLGSATAQLKLTIALTPTAVVNPVSTLIKRGAGPAICKITKGTPTAYSYAKTVKPDGSETVESITGSNPQIFSGSIAGREKVGVIETGVGYENWGANNGGAAMRLKADFSVTKP